MTRKNLVARIVLPIATLISLETVALGFPFHAPKSPARETDKICAEHIGYYRYSYRQNTGNPCTGELIDKDQVEQHRQRMLELDLERQAEDIIYRLRDKFPYPDRWYEYRTLERLRKEGNQFLFQ